MKSILKLPLLICFLISLGTVPASAQEMPAKTNFTDEELEKFIEINKQVIQMEQQSQQKIVTAIQDEGITVERFNQIAQKRQNPNMELNASEEEMTAFNNAAQVVMQQQQQMQRQVMGMIQKTDGIDVQTFQQIMMAYQQDEEVQQQIDEMLKEQ